MSSLLMLMLFEYDVAMNVRSKNHVKIGGCMMIAEVTLGHW